MPNAPAQLREMAGLTPEEADRYLWALEKATRGFEDSKKRMVRHHPFYGSMLLNTELHWISNPTIPLAAVDGKHLYLNPKGCENLTKKQWDFLIAHEIMHLAHIHSFRKKGRDHMLWNMACDYAINWLINQEPDFDPPTEDLLLDDRFANESPEYIYTVLRDEMKAQAQAQAASGENEDSESEGANQATATGSSSYSGSETPQGDPDKEDKSQGVPSTTLSSSGTTDANQASGTPDKERDKNAGQGYDQSEGTGVRHVKVDWLHGDVLDGAAIDDMERDAMEARIKQITFQAAYHARAIGADKDVAAAVIESQAPKRSWQISLASFVSNTVDKDDYSYRKPHRRYVPQGVYMPTLHGQKPPKLMAIVIDVSSSIRQEQLDKFWEELAGLIALHPNLKFKTYFVNTKIVKEMELGIEDLPLELDVPGYGGTNFKPAYEDIEEKMLEVSGLIYFTDLECDQYPSEPEYPTMWLNFGRPQQNDGYRRWEPPFGEIVDMIQ
jgi:predicted metal-dependent peptidase